jgi:hypothetical protein
MIKFQYLSLIKHLNPDFFNLISCFLNRPNETNKKKRKRKTDIYNNDEYTLVKKVINIFDINQNDILNVDNNINYKFIIYNRVSTFKQSENCSLSDQYMTSVNCLYNHKISDLELIVSVDECHTAFKSHPILLFIIISTLKNITLCVSHTDRLSRNIDLFRELCPLMRKNKIKILITGENNSYGNEIIFNNSSYELDVLDMVNKILPGQIESCKKSVLQKSINKDLKRKKYGHNIIDNEFVINFIEMDIIELIKILKNGNVDSNTVDNHLQKIYEYYHDKNYDKVVFIDSKGNESHYLQSDGMSYQGISDLLNIYKIPYYKDIKWSSNIVKHIYNNDNDNDNNIELGNFNEITI